MHLSKAGSNNGAVNDIVQTIKRYELWWTLGLFDIKQRYRRSVLGPFWITLSSAVFISALSFIWSSLFNIPVETYVPFFAIGYILWNFFSALLVDFSVGFIQFEGHIKQIPSPLSSYLLRLYIRHLSVFAHNALLIVIVLMIFPQNISFSALLICTFGLLMISIFAVTFGGVLAVVCARYRDLPQIIQTFVQVIFFATPVIWENRLSANRAWVVDFNPLYYFIEIFRAPLLGRHLPEYTLPVTVGCCVLTSLVYVAVLSKWRNRIVYWL